MIPADYDAKLLYCFIYLFKTSIRKFDGCLNLHEGFPKVTERFFSTFIKKFYKQKRFTKKKFPERYSQAFP